ncbi:MAG: DinB family protein [Chloroflexota bacterium]
MNFEKLYAELEINAGTIRALVNGITQEEAQVKPTPEAWSILEVICHLYDEEIKDFRPRLDVILHRPTEEFAPNDSQESLTERNYNEQDLAVMLGKFLEEREKSLEWLRELGAGANWDVSYTTPWRTMTSGDMFASWVSHDTYHMRQLVELRHARIDQLSAPYKTEYAGDWSGGT